MSQQSSDAPDDAPEHDRFVGGQRTAEPKPVVITIRANELIEWLKHVKKGQEPIVPYDDDPAKMLASAYKERGNILHYLNHRIRAFLPLDTPP